jgi:streptomycin 6-kinase
VRVDGLVGPVADDEVRQRLGRRHGAAIGPWLDELPTVLAELAHEWQVDIRSVVRRGTVSLVLNCRDPRGTPLILKVSPDRQRIAAEARALSAWHTRHVPHVLASHVGLGALLMEAIQPGTAVDESGRLPATPALAELVHALHEHGLIPSSVPPIEDRIASLYRSGEANYDRRPDLVDLVPRSVYARGRRSATTLARQSGPRVVLHGDLTPANVLHAGPGRGLVAVDPAPCWGDPAFDTVDLVMWRADDMATVVARAQALGDRLGFPEEAALRWCAAFAAMTALELAEAAPPGAPTSSRITMLLELERSF